MAKRFFCAGAKLLPALMPIYALLFFALGPAPVQAQFLCMATSGTAQGATAANNPTNTACGPAANATGTNGANNTAIGANTSANGDRSGNTAVGVLAAAGGNGSGNTALGITANAGGDGSQNTAVGTAAVADGGNSRNVAFGATANAGGAGSFNIAIGNNANASGDGTNNIAIGNAAAATGANATAIGNGAQATFANSAAIGNGAVATRANQQTFGTAGNTYTMSGITSAASRAAQSGPTQIVTSDAGGNLATTTLSSLGIASAADLGAINARLDDLSGRVDKAYTGVAMAFALAGVPQLLPSEKFAISTNYGTFESKSGMALAAAVRLNDRMQLNAGIGYGFNESTVGGRVGLRLGF